MSWRRCRAAATPSKRSASSLPTRSSSSVCLSVCRRAAGSVREAYVRHGRRAVLVVKSERRDVQQVHSPAADWRRALELLAAVEPTGESPVARLLAEEASPAGRALELVVVTARLERALADRLVQRSLAR